MPELPHELQQYILMLALLLQLKTSLPYKLLDDRRFYHGSGWLNGGPAIRARSAMSMEDRTRKRSMSSDGHDIEVMLHPLSMDTRQLADTS